MTAATPLLLLPGVLSDSTVWSRQLALLADCAPLAVDGYGEASSLAAMAERVLALAPPRFSLAGHSMGGRVALEVVRLAPQRVERLALVNSAVHPVKPGEAEARLAMIELGRSRGIAALVDQWLPPMVNPRSHDDPAVMEPLRAMCLAAGVAAFERQMRALLARSDQRPLLPAIRCPALVLTGRQDPWSRVEQAHDIAAVIPGGELAVIEDCGHMAPVEAPAAVAAALRRWLGRPGQSVP